jgi:SAM-dependent methyltransferase
VGKGEAVTNVLNLGAGNRIIEGAVNHDRIVHRPEISVAHDLNRLHWPWEDESFDVISARAVFEHLDIDLVACLDECWRILRPGGTLDIKLPYWQHPDSWADPTHRRAYDLQVFDWFDPETPNGKTYGFYTPRKWRIVWKNFANGKCSSIAAEMVVRK